MHIVGYVSQIARRCTVTLPELVKEIDLKSIAERRVGSNPAGDDDVLDVPLIYCLQNQQACLGKHLPRTALAKRELIFAAAIVLPSCFASSAVR